MTAHHPRLVGLTGRKRSGKDTEAGVSDDLVDLEVINDGTLQDLERALRNALPIE